MADEGTAAGEIIEIELGFDPMRAHLIHEACRAEGFQVGLRLMDQNGQTPLMHPLVPHRLMVREGDVEHVYEIVERTMPSEVGDEGPVKARWTLRRFLRLAVAFLILGPILSGMIMMVVSVIRAL